MQAWLIRSFVLTLVLTLVLALLAVVAPSPALGQQQPAPGADAAPQRERPRSFGEGRGDGRVEGRVEPRGDGRVTDPSSPGADNAPGNAAEGFRQPLPIESTEEWQKAMEFAKEHSPKRWAWLQRLSEDWQQGIKERFFWRFRDLERLRNTDREMYEIRLRRLGIEDDIYAISAPVRQEGAVLTQEDVSKLRERVTALVDLGLEERELRVQRLRDMLKREEGALAHERSQRESIIADHVSALEQGRMRGILGSGASGPRGGFGGPGGPGAPGGGPGAGGQPGAAPPTPPPAP